MDNGNTYGACAYGSGTYQNQNCTTDNGQVVTTPGAPDTGVWGQITGGNPVMTGGVLLVGAVLIAILLSGIKKLARRSR